MISSMVLPMCRLGRDSVGPREPLVHVEVAALRVEDGDAHRGALEERLEQAAGELVDHSSSPTRMARATAAARSETPSFS